MLMMKRWNTPDETLLNCWRKEAATINVAHFYFNRHPWQKIDMPMRIRIRTPFDRYLHWHTLGDLCEIARSIVRGNQ